MVARSKKKTEKLDIPIFTCRGTVIEEDFGVSKLKRGTTLALNTIGIGWSVLSVVVVSANLKVLVLHNDNTRYALWYFDGNNNFISNQLEKAVSQGLDINDAFSLLKLFLENVVSHKDHFAWFYGNVEFLKAVLSEVRFLTGSFKKVSPADSAEVIKKIPDFLRLNAGDFQDFLIGDFDNVINKDGYYISGGIVVNNFHIIYPVFDFDRKLTFLQFVGLHSGFSFACFDLNCLTFYILSDIAPLNTLELFFEHLNQFLPDIIQYFNAGCTNISGILRNQHLGHNLWNDLTGVCRLENNGLLAKLQEIVLVGGKIIEPWISVTEFNSDLKVNYSITSNIDLAKYIYKNGIFPIRVGDEFITKKLVEMIVDKFQSDCTEDVYKSPDELRVVFGLRFENRTWLNQKHGLLQLAYYLCSKADKLTIIVDGHDLIPSTNKVQQSHYESNDGQIIALENEIVEFLTAELSSTNVKVINSVATSIDFSVKWIDSADFFIAPWGAGLAKYKWVSNLPGVIFTSQWNMLNLSALSIYESPRYRQEAKECIYVSKDYIQDKDCTTNNVQVKDAPEHPSRADFYVDIKGIKLAIDKVLKQIGR